MKPFDPALPYASRREPLLADEAVATSQPLAAQAGLDMLARGGSAVDAALATAIALAVVEPVGTGIGSDLFAIVWDGQRLMGLNASGRAPAAWHRSAFAGLEEMPRSGWNSVTIPGAVSGWVTLSQRYGRLPFADLFAPAIRYAHDGHAVSPVVAYRWHKGAQRLGREPGFAEAFLPRGRAPAAGERFACAPMAETLARIAESGGESFYRGELAQRMVQHARACGAGHTLDDFAQHGCEWVDTISHAYRGWTVHELPPNGQGLAALIALGILEHFDLASLGPDDARAWHLQIEAMKLAVADAHALIADPSAMPVAPHELLDPDYLARRARLIDTRRAATYACGMPVGGTVYLAAADHAGMMVSLIQSNYMGFGSGVVVPGTGISLQNRGAGFSLHPGHPNEVAPGKRPFHTIIPGFLMRDGAPVGPFGVMGGAMQPQGHVQVLTRTLDHGQNPQAALDAPRWKLDAGLQVAIEPAAPNRLRAALADLGHQLVTPDVIMEMGAGQIVWRCDDGGYVAASDPRRDGAAVGR